MCILRRIALLVLICLLPILPAQALTPEMDMDRYVLAAGKHVRMGNYQEAEQYLQRIVALQLTPPVEFYYVYGEVLYNKGKLQLARETLEKYLQQAGRNGEYYRESLELLTVIEENQQALPTAANTISSESEPVKTDHEQWLEQLQVLYLSDSAQESLLLHINSVLRNFVLFDSRVINLEGTDDRLYQVSVPQPGDVQVVERRSVDGGYQYTSTRITIAGIDPDVQFHCDRQNASCTIEQPASKSSWIQIRLDERAAHELSKSLAALIRELQK